MRRILDLGCGVGRHLAELFGDAGAQWVMAVGVDIDLPSLIRGKCAHPQLDFVCARGEQLPFRSESFQRVISQVSLPYMDIPITLREVHRVLEPGGELRAKLHPFSFTWSELASEMRSGAVSLRLKNLFYRVYVIVNGICLHAFGVNFRFPFGRRRCESFQTERGMRRALAARGFRRIEVVYSDTKIVWPHAGNCRAAAVR